MAADTEEIFELELWGGATERRYRAVRGDVEKMPWGTLRDCADYPDAVKAEARALWTLSAFQEHRTGAQCAASLQALFQCRAPIDLIACFARFPLDEAAHVELASRMAMELGGAVELVVTERDMHREPAANPPLLRAAELVLRTFCVGESLSIPLLHAAWRGATHALPRAVLGRIVRDEAAHGIVGWTFLDWAAPYLSDDDRGFLSLVADAGVGEVRKLWASIAGRDTPSLANGLGWIGDARYLELAAHALDQRVIAPLAARGITVSRRG